jgi:hypothetical protein
LDRLGSRMDTRIWPMVHSGRVVRPTHGRTAKVKDHKKQLNLKYSLFKHMPYFRKIYKHMDKFMQKKALYMGFN